METLQEKEKEVLEHATEGKGFTGDEIWTIKIHDSRFEPLAWVARAVDMPGSGRVTDYLYSTGEEIVGTNGKRMHCFSPAPLPAGYWRPIKRTKGELQLRKEEYSGEYPKYKQLIPDITREHKTVLAYSDTNIVLARLIRAMSEQDALNYEYLDDVMRGCDTFTAHLNDHGKVLYFVGVDRWALVMPMNIK